MPVIEAKKVEDQEIPEETGGEAPALSEEEQVWSDLAEEHDELDSSFDEEEDVTPDKGDEGKEPPAPAAEETREPEGQVAPPPQEEPEPPKPEEPAEQPKPEVPQQPEAQTPPQQQGPTPEQMQVWREEAWNVLSDRYSVSDEDRDAFMEDPGKIQDILPRMMARLHTELFDAVSAQVYRNLPNVVQGVTRTYSAREQQTKEFYRQWPELDSHRDIVNNAARAFMQANPRANFNDFVKTVGAQAWIAARLPISKLAERTGETLVPQTPLPAPVAQTPAIGGATPPPAPKRPMNPYEQMAEEILHDED